MPTSEQTEGCVPEEDRVCGERRRRAGFRCRFEYIEDDGWWMDGWMWMVGGEVELVVEEMQEAEM